LELYLLAKIAQEIL